MRMGGAEVAFPRMGGEKNDAGELAGFERGGVRSGFRLKERLRVAMNVFERFRSGRRSIGVLAGGEVVARARG